MEPGSGAPEAAELGMFGACSSRCRITAVRAGVSSAGSGDERPARAYRGPNGAVDSGARVTRLSSGSDRVERARRRFPEEPLLPPGCGSCAGADGVSKPEMGIRFVGGGAGRGSSGAVGNEPDLGYVAITGLGAGCRAAGANVMADGALCRNMADDDEDSEAKLPAAAATALAWASALVGRPRFFRGGSLGEGCGAGIGIVDGLG